MNLQAFLLFAGALESTRKEASREKDMEISSNEVN